MKKWILLLLMACPCVAQERLSMIYDIGDKNPPTSPLSNAHAFKTVPGANYFAILASSKSYFAGGHWMHSNMMDLGNGPQSTGGWLGFIYNGEVYYPTSLPLKPAMGVKGYMPIGGDAARGCAEWMWDWDGVISGQCNTGKTYREKNLYFANSINTGSEAVKRFILDVRGTGFHTIPQTTFRGQDFCPTAIGKYRNTFDVKHPGVSNKCKHQVGVDDDGIQTIMAGVYDIEDPSKTPLLINFIDGLLLPNAYLVDWNEAQAQIPAIKAAAGQGRVFPLVLVTMGGSLNGQPSFTPTSFAQWLGTVDFSEVYIQCNSPVSGQNDCVQISNALSSLLSPNN